MDIKIIKELESIDIANSDVYIPEHQEIEQAYSLSVADAVNQVWLGVSESGNLEQWKGESWALACMTYLTIDQGEPVSPETLNLVTTVLEDFIPDGPYSTVT